MFWDYDQSPHDQATLKLDYLDKNGKVLASDQTKQRNPQWSKHTITLSVPSGAVKARIYLIAQRFVGTDNDAYFDDVSFYTIGNKINKIIKRSDFYDTQQHFNRRRIYRRWIVIDCVRL